jgi:uncharacterized spore protein YtfJ
VPQATICTASVLRKHLGGAIAEHRFLDLATGGLGEGGGKGVGLLVDLLEHVVLEVTEVRILDLAGDALHLALHRLAGAS